MSADTALALIGASLREIGVLAPGEAPSADDAEDALDTLNRLIDSDATERLKIYTTTRIEMAITPNLANYLISGSVGFEDGSTSDGFDTAWATVPDDWTLALSGNATITNDTVDFQAGGHSVKMSGTTGSGRIYRDFLVRPGATHTVTIYTKADFTNTGQVQIQNLATGNYLTSGLAWSGSDGFVLTSAAGGGFALQTATFVIESAAAVGAQVCSLRVGLIAQATSFAAWFDTFAIDAVDGLPNSRPIFIDQINLIDTSVTPNVEMPLSMLTEDMWAALTMKDLTSPWPRACYYNPTFPFGTLSLWPVPTSSTISLALYVPTQVPKFQALSDTFSMPPGYEDMYVTGLAVRLCPSYRIEPSQFLKDRASAAAGLVKRANRRLAELTFPGGSLVGTRAGFTYDIKSDT